MNLYADDYERMESLYGAAGKTVAIRELVRSHLQAIDQLAARRRGVAELEIDLDV